MTLELVPLCVVREKPTDVVELGRSLAGSRRVMVRIEEVAWEGPRLKAQLCPGTVAADWKMVGGDGAEKINVHITLKTHDGALIQVRIAGRHDTRVQRSPIYITPVFETTDPRYAWLNAVQAVGKGMTEGGVNVYEIFELR
jgi:hypothetical protein